MGDSKVEFWANMRDEAAHKLHWHLSRAALMVLQGLVLGQSFEEEMALADRAHKEWYAAQQQLLSARPDGGEDQHHGG
jgi:hypothetical protein